MSHDRLSESLDIDRVPTERMVEIIQAEDRSVPDAVAREARSIARAIDAIAERLDEGGRLVYLGAGTSGRIAMLDASELPPTYGVERDLVKVVMAGGEKAFFSAVEGAEDDEEAAVAEIDRCVTGDDAVVGIAASGTTPFTVAGLRKANMIGALTVAVTSAAGSTLAREADIPIVVETGPEVIMGSSRMKSGTAQKLVLNTISTGVMIRLGRVFSNLMVEMPATNLKLRGRAVLMVELAAGVDSEAAERAFLESGSNVKKAIVMAKLGVDADEAQRRLDAAGGVLRGVLPP
ncbi:MAG TPA: N-acetylmuramic acid 6-phosphate etherase [Thermoanaerobaculia bacterium]|nr:N-acetylmuramic acid 6-phosphate etherase [Thermoanaerobaculia bacterium]